MTMNVTKLVAGTASNYFNETVGEVSADHGGGMAGYYDAPGTPPGMWLGSGLPMYGLREGQRASKKQVTRLYDALRHPNTGQQLSRMSDESIAAGKVVGGYDLTFTLPKSVNILWASGDEHVRATIMRAHKEAISESIGWFERHEAYSRSGKGGTVMQRAQGVVAVSFTHWDTRDHDPHLHDHVLVSNMVRRADGHMGTLDGRSLLRCGVAISERHTNLFMDKLTERLGVQWRRREDITSHASVYEIAGVDDRLIANFSKRHNQLQEKKEHLVEKAATSGKPIDKNILKRIDHEAWRETRKAKPKQPLSLGELMHGWRKDMRRQGVDPRGLADACTHIDSTAMDLHAMRGDERAMTRLGVLLDDAVHDAGGRGMSETLHEHVKAQRTRISEANIRAEASRLTRGIRLMDGQADELNDLLTDVETARLVPLAPERYELSEQLRADHELSTWNGRAVTDDPEGNVYATRELLDAEREFMDRAKAVYRPATQLSRTRIRDEVAYASAHATHRLAPDQEQAAVSLLEASDMIVALNGPAGTGKTTTLRAMVHAIDELQGEGKVLGLAPTAGAAGELRKSLGVGTETLAKIIYEARTGHLEHRLAQAERRYRSATTRPARAAAREQVATLTAQETAIRIPRDGYVIVDEAGMADTMSLSELSRLCADAHAKIIMVGDTMQLTSPGEGTGTFPWVVEHGRSATLTSIFRFNDRQEARRSELLRTGVRDANHGYRAIEAYERAGRIHAVRAIDAEDTVVERMVDDITNQVDSLLVVATNDDLSKLNERISQERQRLGQVEADDNARARLGDGGTAGRGDIICTRRNDRGLNVRNNDLWVVDQVDATGSITCHRKNGQDGRVTLPADYVARDVMGGYAITAQRAQGKTVTRSYLYMPQDTEFTRPALYVAMTRGRQSNDCYVAVTDPEDMRTEGMESYELAFWRQRNRPAYERAGKMEWHGEGEPPNRDHWYTSDDLLPTDMQQARLRLNRIMDAKGDTRLATTWAQDYRESMRSPIHLQSEWHHYAHVLAERRLGEQVIDPATMDALRAQPRYQAMVDSYAQASLIDRRRADAVVRRSLDRDADGIGRALDTAINDRDTGRAGWLAGRYTKAVVAGNESQQVRNAASLLNQSHDMLEQALGEQVRHAGAHAMGPRWARTLGPVPAQDSPRRRQWDSLVTQIASWRAEHAITDPYRPLGKTTNTRDAWRDRLDTRIHLYHRTIPDPDAAYQATPAKPAGFTNAVTRALNTGRPLYLDAGNTPAPVENHYVTVRTTDMAASLAQARQSAPESTRRLLLRFRTPDQRIDAWNALSARERAQAREMTDHGPQPLWTRTIEQLGEQHTLDGLDAQTRAQARLRLEHEQAQEARGLENSASLSEPPTPSMGGPGEGMEPIGM